jgi:hypothetical protein
MRSAVGDHLGTTRLHAGRRPARRLVEHTALAPPLTRTDAYSNVLGVKGRRLTNDKGLIAWLLVVSDESEKIIFRGDRSAG